MTEALKTSQSINMHMSDILSIQIFNESKNILIDQYIKNTLNSDQQKTAIIFTPNPEQLVLAKSDPTFAAALREATINIPDGVGIVWASRLLSMFGKTKPIRERIAGVELVESLTKKFADKKFAWVGGRSQSDPSVELAVSMSGQQVPWLPGYQDISAPTEMEEWAVRSFIKKVQPDVVFVAFGAPHQEYWALRQKYFLQDHGVKLVVVAGGSIDIFAGKLERPAPWIRAAGFEWLFRLIQEPWRWRRQLKLLTFIRLVFAELFK